MRHLVQICPHSRAIFPAKRIQSPPVTRIENESGDPAVLVDGVRKSFPRKRPLAQIVRNPFAWSRERVQALSGVSFTARRGELVGLLGPNGAGKTTLLKILCGLVLPDEGQARVLGVPVGSPALARVLGLVHGEERSFYWRLTARENMAFFARLHQLPAALRDRRIADLLERVNLGGDADRRFSDFSSGMRQRLAIARALLADPPVVLMDEPTRSLDPVSAGEQRDWIRGELHGRLGKTILMATHNLHEAQALCDRVVVLAKGEVKADGSPEDLRRRGLGGVVYRLRVCANEAVGPVHSGTLLERRAQPDGAAELVVRLAHDDGLDALLDELRAQGGRITACGPDEPDLEATFRRLVAPAEAPS
jgi:ABC-2 type transport system ATP-binding protein